MRGGSQQQTQSRAERIAQLNFVDNGSAAADAVTSSVWLPFDLVAGSIFPSIALTVVALSLVFAFVSYVVYDRLIPPPSPEAAPSAAAKLRQRRKICYQMTNFCVNCFLGCAGVYHELFVSAKRYDELEPEESVCGQDDLLRYSGFQLGFQLWAIPIGLFWVSESGAMLAHHVAVILVSFMSGFFIHGFRYWTPFFFGLIELSSVPLAVM